MTTTTMTTMTTMTTGIMTMDMVCTHLVTNEIAFTTTMNDGGIMQTIAVSIKRLS
jgi:hypothetical protein